MKSIRERFIKNHKRVSQYVSESKGYRNVLIYIGDFYTWEPKQGKLENIRRLFAVLEAVTVVLVILSSIPGSSISYSPFVVSAALISLVAWAFEIFGVISFCFKKLPLQEDDYAYLNIMFKITPIVRAVFLIAAAVFGFIWMNGSGSDTVGVLSCIGYILAALIALYLFFRYMKLRKDLKIIPSEYHKPSSSSD